MDRLDADTALRSNTRTSQGLVTLGVLLLVSVIMLTVYANEGSGGPMHALRSVAQTVSSPFEWLGSQLQRPFDRASEVMRNAAAESQTLSELEDKNKELTQRLAEFNEYKLENARLEKLLSLTSAYGSSGIGARVIAPDTSDWSDAITIDKGSRDGVEMDMPVVDGSGVVGQVMSVSATTSEVRLLTDPESKASAILQGSRATGVLSGSLDGSMHLEYISTSYSVSVGELVVTSGLGGVYPKGLLLGVVANVAESTSSLLYDITVTPVVDFSNQEEVIVVMQSDATRAEDVAEFLLENGELPDENQIAAIEQARDASQGEQGATAQADQAVSAQDARVVAAQGGEPAMPQGDQAAPMQGQGEAGL